MTSETDAELYLAQHLLEWEGRAVEIFNPNNRPIEELPAIFVFPNNPHEPLCYAMAADGHVLGSHVCSHEGYAPHDLGVLEGARPDRHEGQYRPHYPDGYRMEFVRSRDVKTHPGLKVAYANNQALAAAAKHPEAA